MRRRIVTVAALVVATSARAQLAGDLLLGQYGLAAGTQAPEGLVLTGFLYGYHSTTVVGPNGNTVPGSTGSLGIFVPGVSVWYVSPLKVFGGSYGAQLSIWGTSSRNDFPRLNVDNSSFGFGDMYLKPLELGWHTTYVDVITGFALWIPTGSYTPGGNSNSGQGQWGYEFSLGATVWFDKGHHLNLSTQAFYDIYSPKSGTIGPSNTQLQTGNIFTLMGGLGYQFLGGGLNVGIPYSIQWKVTEDTLPPGIGPVLPGIQAAKDWRVGLGAEVDLFWNASNGITARFLQGFAGANTTNGQSYFLYYNHIFSFGKHGKS
jgi:hypothetical protein